MVPDVSIIVTTFDYGRYLSRCLRSCLSQRWTNVEVLVIDDASTDNTGSIVDQFKDDIKYTRLDKNMGVSFAANVGLSAARSQLVVRVDADDYVTADFCYILKRAIEMNHDAFGVACDALLVDEYENVIGRRSAQKEPFSCGIMYRRDLLLSAGGYDEKMRHREEEELRKRFGQDYKIVFLPMTLYRYKRHSFNKTLSKEYVETIV